ncbi:MAG: hypothetical protein ABR591_08825 [Candidatus Velthaea sp.]
MENTATAPASRASVTFCQLRSGVPLVGGYGAFAVTNSVRAAALS